MRIVSLLPAATDIVASLGLGSQLVGRTHECDWPPEVVTAVPVVTTPRVNPGADDREIRLDGDHGGSCPFSLDAEMIALLRPDLIITQELCDACAVSYQQLNSVVRSLPGQPRVVSLDAGTIDGILGTVTTIGDVTDAQTTAKEVVTRARDRITAVRQLVADRDLARVVALEWLDPLWPVGHWIPEQIVYAGGLDLVGRLGEKTDPVDWEAVVDAAPDVLLLMPCGRSIEHTASSLSLLQSRPGWADIPAVRAGRVWILDGPSLFNRPGPRIARGVEVLAEVLHGVDCSVTSDEAVQCPSPVR
jgi:iron complex transport system substrate-binding protein